MRLFPIAIFLLVAGCAAQSTQAALNYVRIDRRPIDELQARAALAQCQGEGANVVADYAGDGGIPTMTGMLTRPSKEATVVNACMARNGYLVQ